MGPTSENGQRSLQNTSVSTGLVTHSEMRYWTANGYVDDDDNDNDDAAWGSDQGYQQSTSTALVGPLNPASTSGYHLDSSYTQHLSPQAYYDTSTFIYHPAIASGWQTTSGHVHPQGHPQPLAQHSFNQWAPPPLTLPNPPSSPLVYDEAYIQALITPYLELCNDPRIYREPSDLSGVISEQEIQSAERCGGGGFGDVYSLRHVLLGHIAMKRVREAGNEKAVAALRERARKEAKIWHDLNHPNVLKFHGVYETKFHFFLVSVFAKNGTIMEYIEAHPYVDRLRLLSEAACGLAYLHANKIIHGDVKAANILISDDERAMVCDFGLSRPEDTDTSSAVRGAGSTRWMSPEVLLGEGRTPASDVWAFGMSIAEVLSGAIPFSELRTEALVTKAVLEGTLIPRQTPTTSPRGESYVLAWSVATLCWDRDPWRRTTMERASSRLAKSFPDVHTLEGHSRSVRSVAFSPDSRTLASASWDKTIRLWDVAQAIPLGTPLEGHTSWVTSVAFSPNGKTLVSGSEDRTLRLWDVTTGRTIGEPLTGHTYKVLSVTSSPDGRKIASSSGDTTIRIWDSVSRRCVAVLEGHTWSAMSIAFSPDGKTLVSSGAWDHAVRRWDVTTNAPIGEPMEGHAGMVQSVAFSPDGSTIASGSDDRTVRLWDARSGEPKGAPLAGHTHHVLSVAFHPNGRLLASGSVDKTIRIWDLTTAPPTTKLELKDHTWSVESVVFSPDGKWLASGSWDRTVRLWDLEVLLGTI